MFKKVDLSPTIWISSVKHLELYRQIMESTTLREKFSGHYPVPNSFPYIKLNFNGKRPSLFFSRGDLTLKNDKITYHAIKGEDWLFETYRYLDDSLSFELSDSNLKSIEWYPHEKLSRGLFKWKWIMIKCDGKVMDGDFLICADGSENTKTLFEMLSQFKNGQKVTASLNDPSATRMVSWSYIGIILFVIYLILDLIFELIYGTINGNIGGPLVVGVILLADFFIFCSMIWFVLNGKENSKIAHQARFFIFIFLGLMWINIIRIHFFP